jgi:hypothetical protein
MEDRSVLVSTTYSKSVLRVAAEEVAAAHPGVSYFPSYEVITGNYTRGAYFAEGLRDVTEAGVQHVMRLFLNHYMDFVQQDTIPEPPAAPPSPMPNDARRELEAVAKVLCDELLLEPTQVSLGQSMETEPYPPSTSINSPAAPSTHPTAVSSAA